MGVSFDRFTAAARDVLGLEPGQDFSPKQESDAKQEYERWQAHYDRDRAEPGASQSPGAEGVRARRPQGATPDPAHRAQFQRRDPDKGLDR